MTQLSWTPIRKGAIYCSPACGAGCTHKKYMKACDDADKLAAKCHKEAGGKWVTRVHENLGWHYNVYLKGGNIAIYQHDDKTYSVMSHRSGTPTFVHVGIKSTSIKELVDKQIALVEDHVHGWVNYINRNKRALKK